MPSVIPGFEYDIFISYRHNDNRSGWVAEFVKALQEELAATIKEPVTVYFDVNPHDGLLENHNVDKSLERKIKCLIFIPIISQTYCDTKSFAWQHEFCTFNKLAKDDQFGRDIKLSNGNVASRILPVKIHDLDAEDNSLLEIELGGILRAIEFIFRSPGVNRPLRPKDDDVVEITHTIFYRDQINKVANAIKELIVSMQSIEKPARGILPLLQTKRVPPSARKRISLTAAFVGIIAIAAYAFFYFGGVGKTLDKKIDRSVAVIPFVDLSPNHDKEYFTDGMMEEILNHLHKIGELKVTSRTSSMRYKGETKKSVKEIADELGVAHILEGSVRLQDNTIRITMQLIKAETDEHIWAENYDRNFSDVFAIQSEVAQEVARALKATISPEAQRIIQTRLTSNMEAYELFLKANEMTRYVGKENTDAISMLEKAVELDPNFSGAWVQIGFRLTVGSTYMSTSGMNPGEAWKISKPYFEKALALDKDNGNAHRMMAWSSLWYEWNFEIAEKEYAETQRIFPNYSWTDFHLAMGQFEQAYIGALASVEIDSRNFNTWTGLLLGSYFADHDPRGTLRKVLTTPLVRDNILVQAESARIYMYLKEYDQAISITKQVFMDYPELKSPRLAAIQAISYNRTNRSDEANKIIDTLKQISEKTAGGSPSFYLAMIYADRGESDLAFTWLEKSYQDHEVEMYWLKVEPPFESIRSDPRYKLMLDKVGFP